MLYELLTGALPYDVSDTTIVQAACVIREQTPAPPSSVRPKLHGDAETIVLKALEKEREKRYQSAAELAADIRRFLKREPIEARPPTAWTRMAHWIARRPMLATTADCVAIVVLTLSSVFATAWVAMQRPYKIVTVRDPGLEDRTSLRQARLETMNGSILKTWGGRTPAALGVAELVDRPYELGGGRVIVLGGGRDAYPPLRKILCVFNADGDLENPIWEKRITTKEIPPELREKRGYTGDDFTFRYAWVLDVFPEKPGDEIVATFGHQSRSQGVIRIYDLAGTLLYQVWHDGVLSNCRWLEDVGLLVLAGDWHALHYMGNGDLKSNRLRDIVVFALRPKVEDICDDWLKPTGDPDSDDSLTPAWFLLLRPAGIEERFYHYTLDPPRRSKAGGRVLISIIFNADGSTGIGWDIDRFGQKVPGSRVLGDGYNRNRNRNLPREHPDWLPDPNDVKLVPYE